MKYRLIPLILWVILITIGIGHKTACAEESIIPSTDSILLGERLVYKITWLKIPVGIGEVWVKEKTNLNGREVFHIMGMIRMNNVLSKIFPMQDEAHSWVDIKTLQSVQFEKNIRELLTRTHEKMSFDSAAGKGYFESFKTGEKSEFTITAPIQDALSVVYWIRQQTLVPGESVKTMLVADQKEWELEAHIRGRKTVKIHGEKLKALLVEPVTRVEGKERRGKAWFYVTDDFSHRPIRIIYKAPFGNIIGTLE